MYNANLSALESHTRIARRATTCASASPTSNQINTYNAMFDQIRQRIEIDKMDIECLTGGVGPRIEQCVTLRSTNRTYRILTLVGIVVCLFVLTIEQRMTKNRLD